MNGAKLRRFLQTFFIMLLVAYTTLFAYQSLSHPSINNQTIINEKYVGKDYDSNYVVDDQPKLETVAVNKITSEIPSVTATLRPPTTTLNDVFISVKTTIQYHKTRLELILTTWFQLAREQTWFFTDSDDAELQKKTHGHMINTNCSASHSRRALCCKTAVEFDTFIDSNKKWFCHFDDDNYVNVPRLVRFLGDYNPREDWYLGKPSIKTPLAMNSRDKNSQKVKFWFATGGAGFCISRALALKMMPFAGGGKFKRTGEKILLPDDVTMGYIIEHLLKKPLTVVDQFHSHLEPMRFIRQEIISDQISFSYSNHKDDWNVVKIKGFNTKVDATRFLSLHCYLFPYFKFCPR